MHVFTPCVPRSDVQAPQLQLFAILKKELSVSFMSTTSIHEAPEVVVVILNWNAHEETIAAVESVLKMDYPSLRVAVVDNGSTEDPARTLAPILGDRVELILSPENVGYTGGCNLGIDVALRRHAAYVWLLNSDAITEPGTLSSLVAIAEDDPMVGLVSPLIATLQDPTRLMNAGGIYMPEVPYYNTTKKIEQAREWAEKRPGDVTLLGTAMLVRVELIRKIGKLDPGLFAYFEDADYSIRSIRAGYRNVVDFNSSVYHMEKSTAFNPHEVKPHYWYYMARNEIRFWKKYSNSIAKLKRFWWAYGFQLSHLRQLEGNERSQQAILAGLWDGFINRTGAYLPDRRMPGVLSSAVLAHSRRRA
jgi:GT2 family glycosyltransferase